MGLPDVKPMQAAVLASLEKQAVQAVGGFAPDAMLRLWFTTLPQMSHADAGDVHPAWYRRDQRAARDPAVGAVRAWAARRTP